ncbi:Short-chain dehydrogenase/reductase SDR [Candidatus Burkholderia verschuerenii]|uniref:Short-chain dehydrogenase/reductase SDR n=1 Tax=Candidatus Burkholderia verschuerenii TaxID=242163 RepID=A0A0L0MC11_9BURK|nr:SDR family oxidoreductase [Candidatus Burkholderia verschuerenii]KND59821.1 Short-chain dehydrogenase/reductase SDR [Candidatus Burkholderia verschuerenii]
MKTVLIVGASRGIGHEFARAYCRDGWRVLATARDKTSLSALDAMGAQTFSVDVTQAEQIASLAWQLDEEKLDVAILVSGVYGPRTESVETVSREDFDQVMHTNVLGPMQLLPVLLPLTDAARGVLAVVSSKMGSIAEASGTTGWLYRTSKAAVNCAVKIASLESRHSACIALHPGWVRTDMGGSSAAIDVTHSVSGMRGVIAEAGAMREEFNGSFVQYDGTKLEW